LRSKSQNFPVIYTLCLRFDVWFLENLYARFVSLCFITTTSSGLDMNRLTSKQKGSISAFQGGGLESSRVRGAHLSSRAAGQSKIWNSRRAFTSDCALSNLVQTDQKCNAKTANDNPRSLLTDQGFMMRLTIDACDVTELRRRVIGSCGDLVIFMRIQPLLHARKMRVWILLERQEFDFVARIIKSGLPRAEFEQAADS
jgi:hypothetical protein